MSEIAKPERRWAQRHDTKLPVRLSGVLVRHQDSGDEDVLLIAGHTHDLSQTGLALILPAGSVTAESLRSEEKLHIVLQLPSGHVALEARLVRRQPLGDGTELIGAHILGMDQSEQAHFSEYLDQLAHN